MTGISPHSCFCRLWICPVGIKHVERFSEGIPGPRHRKELSRSAPGLVYPIRWPVTHFVPIHESGREQTGIGEQHWS